MLTKKILLTIFFVRYKIMRIFATAKNKKIILRNERER